MSSQSPSDDGEDPLIKASIATDNLYQIHDSFYPENPDEKFPNCSKNLSIVSTCSILYNLVKLNPSLTDAWLSLGNCFWKKEDSVSAKNCFNRALSKGPDKNVLCQLSMLERKMAQDTENKTELIEDSIRHAKEAIALDVADGNSWYNLGNACLTSFFLHRELGITRKFVSH